jgi:hypothetical protein
MGKPISCKAFRELLERDDDLTEAECEAFEMHLKACRRHARQMAKDEAEIGPRLRAFGQKLNDAFDSGVANGISWDAWNAETLAWAIAPHLRDRIEKHFDIQTTTLSESIIEMLIDSMKKRPKQIGRAETLHRVCALQLLCYVDETGELVFEGAPRPVFRG